MIIKGIRLRTSSSIGRTILHLQNGDDNDAVIFVSGTPADIRDMRRDAVDVGSKYAVRHWIVAPQKATTRNQMIDVVDNLGKEFAFDPTRAVIIEHRKQRATSDATDVHWHVLVGEVDPATGSILATSYDRIKHELIARIAEFSFGHPFVLGKHSSTVIKGLRKRNLHCIADQLEQILYQSDTIPAEAFTHAEHQRTKREGLDLPTLRGTIAGAFVNACTRKEFERSIAAIGLTLSTGKKDGVWVVVDVASGGTVGALHRLAKVRKDAVTCFMQAEGDPVRQSEAARPAPPSDLDKVGEESALNGVVDSKPPVPHQVEVNSQLAELERLALDDINQSFPEFVPTTGMRNAATNVGNALKELSRIASLRTQLQFELARAPKVQWWCYLTGSAKRRLDQVKSLIAELDRVETDFTRKEVSVSAYRIREVREQKSARESYLSASKAAGRRLQNAHETLAVVHQARDILKQEPDFRSVGLDTLLRRARNMLKEKNVVENKLSQLAELEGGGLRRLSR